MAAVPPTGPVTAGFLPSADLTFSPLAQTADGGRSWSPALPTALVRVPDALAASATGRVLALVPGDGQTVVSSPGGVSTWSPLVTTDAVAREDPACRVSAISAVASCAGSQLLLGVTCAATGHLGIVTTSVPSPTGSASGWRDVGPAIGTGRAGTASVLRLEGRLEGTPEGAAGLAAVRSSSGASLVAFWGVGALGHWVETRPTTLPAGWTLESTVVGDSQHGVAVLLASGSRRRVERAIGMGGGAAWTPLPSPPAGTDAVATVGAEVDAFVASGSAHGVGVVTDIGGVEPWSGDHRSHPVRVLELMRVPRRIGVDVAADTPAGSDPVRGRR